MPTNHTIPCSCTTCLQAVATSLEQEVADLECKVQNAKQGGWRLIKYSLPITVTIGFLIGLAGSCHVQKKHTTCANKVNYSNE
jgi:hypothetical protein